MEKLCCVFKKPGKDWPEKINNNFKLVVLKEAIGREIGIRYELGRELGRDEFGIIYLCKDRETNEELACKSISKNKLRTSAIHIENVRREVEIMRQLPKHPNIVLLKDTYEDEDHVHLVMELCEGGQLFDRIVAKGYYTEHAAASVVKTIVEVVQICHKHGVVHRNLNLENFWFAGKTKIAPLKVTDFRLSIFFKPGERLSQIVGNLYYMAPELLNRNYGPEIDIWSAGVILYILLYGFPPFWAETEQGVAKAITQSVIDFPLSYRSDNARDLVRKMLDPDPKFRLTPQEVLEHPWLIEHIKISKQGRVMKRRDAQNHEWKRRRKSQHLVMKLLNAHEVLDHPWLQNAKTAPNVSLGETIRANLLQYSVMNKLTKTTSMVIAKYVSAAEGFESEKFWVIDTGNTTYNFNYAELEVRLHKLGQQIPDVDVQSLIDYFEPCPGYGERRCRHPDYAEILAILIQVRKISHEEHVDRAFHFFDRNQSGYIKLEELRKALADEINTKNKEVIDAIMHRVNTNKDRRISYEEITNRSLKLMNEWSSELIND